MGTGMKLVSVPRMKIGTHSIASCRPCLYTEAHRASSWATGIATHRSCALTHAGRQPVFVVASAFKGRAITSVEDDRKTGTLFGPTSFEYGVMLSLANQRLMALYCICRSVHFELYFMLFLSTASCACLSRYRW